MCRRIQCEDCHKPSYTGCGRHVEEILASVPREARCQCRNAVSANKGAALVQPLYAASA